MTCSIATLFTTNPTWTGRGKNPGLRGEKLATDRLNHGMTKITTNRLNHSMTKIATNRLNHSMIKIRFQKYLLKFNI